MLRPYLELVRVFLTPTAVADSLAGYLLAISVTGGRFSAPVAAAACAASIALYWLGMAANDLHDRGRDAVRAPGRPIPSGRIPPRHALALCVALGVVGLGLASLVGALAAAVVVIALVVAYDAGGKDIPLLGPLLMGMCRGGNFLLGASAAPGLAAALRQDGVIWGAALLTAYVFGVTAVSELEDTPFARSRLFLRSLPSFLVAATYVPLARGGWDGWAAAAAVALLVADALRTALRAAADGSSQVHPAAIYVRKALGGIFVVDAATLVILARDRSLALAGVAALAALFVATQAWKRRWMRRGSAGS
jgi:4-hydroxybenzoate polyprenyltransferase